MDVRNMYSRTYRQVPSFRTLRYHISPSAYALVRVYLRQFKQPELRARSCACACVCVCVFV